MNIYINEKKHAEITKRVKLEAHTRKRSESFIVREKLSQAYGLNGKKGSD